MQPHSAVNDSNYDLIASPVSPWVKGESHSARMRRVDNMRRISYGPSLQPEGTISGFKDWDTPTGLGLLGLTVLGGIAAGVSSGVPTGSKRSREKGTRGLTAATVIGGVCGLGFAATTDSPLIKRNPFNLTTAPKYESVNANNYPAGNNRGPVMLEAEKPLIISTELAEDFASIPAFALLGALSHGFGRYVLLSLSMTKNTIPALRVLGNAITGN